MALDELKKLLQQSFVIDNKRVPLGNAIREFLKESTEARMAIGYLFIDGFRAIAGAFGHLDNLQVLIGHKTNLETKAVLSILHQKPKGMWGRFLALFTRKRELTLEDEMRALFKELSDLDLQSLYDLIKSGKAKFKIYYLPEAYFHSKLYLFSLPIGRTGESLETVSIVGSGNFSLPGFQSNVELNLYVSDLEKTRKLEEWFSERWEEAQDFDPYLIEVIEGEFRKRQKSLQPFPQLELILPERVTINTPTNIAFAHRHLVSLSLEKADREGVPELVQAVEVGEKEETTVSVVFTKAGTVFLRGFGEDILGRKVYTRWQSLTVEKEVPKEEIFSPRDFYLITLYKFFEPYVEKTLQQLKLFEEEREIEPLKPWQGDAIDTVWTTLNRYGGTILADSVGLGKTRIAVCVIKRFLGENWEKKVLVAMPTVLEETVWRKELENEGLWLDGRLDHRVALQHLEVMGRESFEPQLFKDVGLIVIDEAHLFRNPNTGRYEALTEIIYRNREAKLLFVTATPINNTVNDLKSLFMLFLSETAFVSTGVSNLWEIFKDFQDEDTEVRQRARQRLDAILNQVAVKRTRRFLEREYGFKEFPNRELERLDYSLTKETTEILNLLDSAFDQWRFPQYQLKAYKFSLSPEEETELRESRFVVPFVEFLFVKRLESSLRAFLNSMERQKAILDTLRLFLTGFGKEHKERIVSEANLFLGEEGGLELLTKKMKADLEDIVRNPKSYDLEKLRADIESDLKIVRTLHDKTAEAMPNDSKAQTLTTILENGLKGKKTLIFTQYIDTAEHLYEALKKKYGGVVGLLTGEEKDKDSLIARFAPEANNTSTEFLTKRGEVQILVATDVLSVGLNLQDCQHLISYDLPWNPVVLLQREGRIDRLGQKKKEVCIINFFPPESIETIIGILTKLRQKLLDIAETVGKEERALEAEELINPKEFQAVMKRLEQRDASVIDDLEEKTEETYQNLTDFLRMRFRQEIQNPETLHRMRRLSEILPQYALLIGGDKSEYLLLMELGDRMELWLFDGKEVSKDDRNIIALLSEAQNVIESRTGIQFPDIVNEAKQVYVKELEQLKMKGGMPGIIVGKVKSRLQAIYFRKGKLAPKAGEVTRKLEESLISGMEEKKLREVLKEEKDEKFLSMLEDLLWLAPKKEAITQAASVGDIFFWAGLMKERVNIL